MGFDHSKETAKENREDKSFLGRLFPKSKKTSKQKKEEKKRRKVKEFILSGFQKIVERAGALMDYLVKSRFKLGKLVLEGSGIGKSVSDQKGYYSEEELHTFALAAASARKEERELESTVTTMRRLSRRDYSLESTGKHLTSYFGSEVASSYTRFTKAIDPLILRPKSNIETPSQDHSGDSFGKRVAATILLGAALTNHYQEARNEMQSWSLEMREKSPISFVQYAPTIKSSPPGGELFLKDPMKQEKEALKREAAHLKMRGKIVDILKDKLEGKKTAIRLFKRVDVEMGSTNEGDSIREKLKLKVTTKLFEFGEWNVKYT